MDCKTFVLYLTFFKYCECQNANYIVLTILELLRTSLITFFTASIAV